MRPSGPALLLLTLLPGCGGQPITNPLTLAVWRRDQILVEEEGRCDHAKTTRVAAALIPL